MRPFQLPVLPPTNPISPMPHPARPGVYVVAAPDGPPGPIVFDSPHSGFHWPADFQPAASRQTILTTWDAYVEELWSGVTASGATLLAGLFPRAYIDANRAVTDIDTELLATPWPEPVAMTDYTQRGMGLIRRYGLPGIPMYAQKLSVDAVRHRIDAYYLPYRAQLQKLLDEAHRVHGGVWHVDCHSMKSRGNAMNVDSGSARPDFVVSDRDGTTADPAFTRWVAEALTGLGYKVTVNTPYRGGNIVVANGNPARNRHSLQIEINRGLYMDETTFERNAGFILLQRNLTHFARSLRDQVTSLLSRPSSA